MPDSHQVKISATSLTVDDVDLSANSLRDAFTVRQHGPMTVIEVKLFFDSKDVEVDWNSFDEVQVGPENTVATLVGSRSFRGGKAKS